MIASDMGRQFPKNRINRYVPSYLCGGKQQAPHPGSD
jgi:hypothetical protein